MIEFELEIGFLHIMSFNMVSKISLNMYGRNGVFVDFRICISGMLLVGLNYFLHYTKMRESEMWVRLSKLYY